MESSSSSPKLPRRQLNLKLKIAAKEDERSLPPHEYVLADNPDIAVRTSICCRVLETFTRPKRVIVSSER